MVAVASTLASSRWGCWESGWVGWQPPPARRARGIVGGSPAWQGHDGDASSRGRGPAINARTSLLISTSSADGRNTGMRIIILYRGQGLSLSLYFICMYVSFFFVSSFSFNFVCTRKFIICEVYKGLYKEKKSEEKEWKDKERGRMFLLRFVCILYMYVYIRNKNKKSFIYMYKYE